MKVEIWVCKEIGFGGRGYYVVYPKWFSKLDILRFKKIKNGKVEWDLKHSLMKMFIPMWEKVFKFKPLDWEGPEIMELEIWQEFKGYNYQEEKMLAKLERGGLSHDE